MRVLKRWQTNFAEFDPLELLFYLVVALFFVGKAYKPAVAILDLYFLVRLVKDPAIRARLAQYRPFVTSLLFFGLYLLLQASLFAQYKGAVLRNVGEQIIYMVMVLAAIATFYDPVRLRRLIFVVWAAVGAVVFDSLYQYFAGYDLFGVSIAPGHRLSAWQKGKTLVGPMLGMFVGILMVAPLLFTGRLRIIGGAILLLTIVTISLSGNRSPLLALMSAFVLAAILSRYRKHIVMAIGVLVTLFGLVIVTNPQLAPKYKALLHPTTNAATAGRYHIFLVGWEMFKEHPLLGIGPGAYSSYFAEYNDKVDWELFGEYQMDIYLHHITPTHVHSVAIDMVLSYGIVGFLLLAWMVWNFFRTFVLRNEYAKLAALGFFYCISPLAFSKAFTNDVWQYMTYLSMVFVVAVAQAFMDETSDSPALHTDRRR
jgi:O-antigen ligase